MKKVLKALLCLILIVVLAVGGFFGWLTATEFRPADVETLTICGGSDAPALPKTGFSVLSWNIGYAGLGAGSDFFMDGGKGVSADNETVNRYLTNIAETIREGEYDLVLLQEVDVDSKRTYGIDETTALMQDVGVSALNYSCPFVPIPWPPMGKVNSGLFTTANYRIDSAERVSLPCPFSWPLRIANLKRCLLVSRLPVEGSDNELVLVNLHLEAYDDGEGKAAQTRQLMDLLEEEYAKGNYVIAGGDFNQTFPGTLDAFPIINEEYWTPGVLEPEALPEGFGYVYDLTVPSCRLLNQPYEPSDIAHTQYYVIDGFIVSANVRVMEAETLDLDFADADHNPIAMFVVLD